MMRYLYNITLSENNRIKKVQQNLNCVQNVWEKTPNYEHSNIISGNNI